MAGFNGRNKKVSSSGGGGVHRRGEGLGTGPVGHNQGGASGLGGHNSSGSSSDRGSGNRASGGGLLGGLLGNLLGGNKTLTIIIIIVVIFLLVRNGACDGLLGGGTTDIDDYVTPTQAPVISDTASYSSGGLSDILGSVFGSGSQEASYSTGSYSTGWNVTNNSGKLNTDVVTGTPAKRTAIHGNGNDQVTIMIYMCGTDLESQGGAATADIQEILNSKLSDNVNILIYTGGCSRWQNNVVSSKYNQIYRIFNANGKTSMQCLNDNCGNAAMTNPDTLASFIKFGKANFPANRQMLIFWDHGGGSISGYGYDEKYSGGGSMSIEKIGKALKNGGVTFDFVGFDACLMATIETATMLTDYADYMIASEEVEPGCGWYYTNWLTKLASDPSMDTLQIGKSISDDFVNYSLKSMNGYDSGLTLSVIDLAEFEYTVPDRFAAFAAAAGEMVYNGENSSEFKKVAQASRSAKEFGATTHIDQIDLVGFASGIGNAESNELAKALISAVKYNVTSKAMQNAYGVSVFFPNNKKSYVKAATNIYDEIGLSEKYSECITKFAAMQTSGGIANGGSGLSSLLGGLSGSLSSSDYSSSYGSTYGQSSSDISSLLGSVWGGGDYSSYSSSSGIESLLGGIGGDSTSLLGSLFSGRSLPTDGVAQYISQNQFDPANLVWKKNANNDLYISLSKEQWSNVSDLALAMFYDDGEGYIDLGRDLDCVIDSDGNLIGENDNLWMAVDGQTVCFYYESYTETDDSIIIKGWIPCLINGIRAEMDIIITETATDSEIVISGARYIYNNGETDTIAKSSTFVAGGEVIDLSQPGSADVNYIGLKEGDKIDFIADFYRYDGTYEDTYMIGEQWTYTEKYDVAYADLGLAGAKPMYVFTDIYNTEYWTEPMR